VSAQELITDNLDLWTGAVTTKSTAGKGTSSGKRGKIELTGIKKLRELILELAVRGKLVEQDPNDEPASVLLERIADEKTRLVKEGKIKKPKKLKQNPAGYSEPFDIPDSWKWTPIDQLAPFPLFDGDWIESKDQDPNGTIRLLQLADIGVGEFKDTSRKYINTETFLNLRCSKLNAGDILIARLPNPIGRAAVFPGLRQDCITAVDVAILRTEGLLNDNYVIYAINSTASRNQVESYGKGATRFRISTGNLKTILIPVPPLPEQHRIVEKVDELMALCDRLEQQVGDQLEAHEVLVDTLLDALTRSADAAEVADNWARIAEHFDTLFTTDASIDKLKQTILQLAVMGRLVEQDPNDEPVTCLLQRYGIKRKPLSLHGWAEVALGSLGEILGGSTPTKSKTEFWEGSIPWVSPKDMKLPLIQDSQVRITEQALKQTSLKVVPVNSLLMVVRGMILAHSFPVAITGREVTINQDMKALVPPEEISTYLLLYLQAGKSNVVELVDRSSHGTCKLVSEKLWSHIIHLPPIEEQARIVEKVDELMALCDHLKARLGEAGETRTQLAETVVEQAVE
jgi:type I restriction enzyme S subunit